MRKFVYTAVFATAISAPALAGAMMDHSAHFDRPTEAVARSFGVSHRTAARYVQQARAAGHLPKTDPGKKKA